MEQGKRLARCFPVITETGYQKSLSVHDDNLLRTDAVYAAQCLQLLRFRIIEASRYPDVAKVHLNKNDSFGFVHRKTY